MFFGKTLVGRASMMDRVVQKTRTVSCAETPVGFKWFAPGLFDGTFCFGGEESAGASFLRMDGTVWTTDKDGPFSRCWRRKSWPSRTRSRVNTTRS